MTFQISEHDVSWLITYTKEFVLRDTAGRRIATVMADREGTVSQLIYPTTKTYTGPESTRALADLLRRAANYAEGK